MTRLAALLAALAAMLVIAPAALAASYVVDDPDDTAELAGDGICDAPGADTCTLREAILEANSSIGLGDTITFTVDPGSTVPLAPMTPVTDATTIDGAGDTTITFDPAATGSLLDLQASSTTLRALTVTGGAGGFAINAAGPSTRLDAVTVGATGATAIRAGGSGVRVDSPRVDDAGGHGIIAPGSSVTISSPTVSDTGGAGIEIGGSNVAVTSPEITGAAGDGLRIGGDGASVSGGRVHGNGGNGATITGQNDRLTRVTFWANGGRAIATGPGANGGISPPQNLRVGPRRSDGSLPLTGTASGTVELWTGDPSSTAMPSFLDAFSAAGDFTYTFPAEPAPGSVFSANVTNGGSSEFATVTVPSDLTSPEAVTARALDTTTVRLDTTETIDPASVQKEDFALTMAGADRAIDAVAVGQDGRHVLITSSGWKAGEAGYVQVRAPGAFSDPTGNQSQSAPRLRVAAAPGDFIAPLGARLAVTPKTICLTRGSRCRRPGMTIRFQTTEPGKAALIVKRGNTVIGRRLYGNVVAGANTLKFNGRLNARKLRAGRYRLLIYVQDMVGNVTDQPPITLFNVRRTTR